MELDNAIKDLLGRLKKTEEELEEEIEKDKPELKELEDVGKHGMTFEEAVKKMEEEVKEKDKDLKAAISKINEIKEDFERIRKDKGYARNPEQMRRAFDDAMNRLESAKDAQGNIEGLREQAEESLRKQLNELEEIGAAEDRSRRISVDAKARLMKLEEDEEKFMNAIDKIEEEHF